MVRLIKPNKAIANLQARKPNPEIGGKRDRSKVTWARKRWLGGRLVKVARTTWAGSIPQTRRPRIKREHMPKTRREKNVPRLKTFFNPRKKGQKRLTRHLVDFRAMVAKLDRPS